jgi:hypothetical protein
LKRSPKSGKQDGSPSWKSPADSGGIGENYQSYVEWILEENHVAVFSNVLTAFSFLPVNKGDIDQLQRKFQQLAPIDGKVDRPHFRDLLCDRFGIDDSLLMDRGTVV